MYTQATNLVKENGMILEAAESLTKVRFYEIRTLKGKVDFL